MPFSNNSALPDNVTNVLPEKAQTIFRRAFNSADRENSETSSIKIAWSAVKKSGFKKGTDGKWARESIFVKFQPVNNNWHNRTTFYEARINKDLIELSLDIDKIEVEHPMIMYSIRESEFYYHLRVMVMDEYMIESTRSSHIYIRKIEEDPILQNNSD